MATFITGVGKIPSNVKLTEYLQSSGTQYIDTGITNSSSDNIVLQANVSYDTVSPANQIMGFSGNAGNGIGLSGSAWWEASSFGTAVANTLYSIQWGVNGTSWNRTVNGKTVTGTRSLYTFSRNMILFASGYDVTSTSHTIDYYCHCKLYDAQIKVNGVLVRDFKPCYDPDGIACLYDEVTQTYFYNMGTGNFVAGGEL